MPKLRAHNLSISLDGYAAGPHQDPENPLGVGGTQLHDWAFPTRAFRRAHGMEDGEGGLDDDFVAEADVAIGATIMGRNMFGPVRGSWENEEWTGWWGDSPPFHHPVFVLTNHPRSSIAMNGGTTFNFVTDGIESALDQAFAAADGRDVRLGGGASTVQQYMRAGLLDYMHVAIVPIMLGDGERLFDNLEGAFDSYECVEMVSSPTVAHARLTRKKQ
jgi:dihydrofolate reductase